MFTFPYPENGLFLFCLNCGIYQRFIFNQKFDGNANEQYVGKCEKCNYLQEINLQNVKAFYQTQTEEL